MMHGASGRPPRNLLPGPAWSRRPWTGNRIGVASFALGLAGLVLCWTMVGGLAALAGLVAGIAGLRRVRRGLADNRAVAVAGIIVSALALLASGVVLAFWISVGDAVTRCTDQDRYPTVPEQRRCLRHEILDDGA